jgi:hypothetical protein
MILWKSQVPDGEAPGRHPTKTTPAGREPKARPGMETPGWNSF